MKKTISAILLVALSAGGGLAQYSAAQQRHEHKLQVQAVAAMERQRAILKCRIWQSQEEWHKRWMQPQELNPTSPCTGIPSE